MNADRRPRPILAAIRVCALATAYCVMAPSSSRADDPPPVQGPPSDGKSLDGWKAVESFKAGDVRVEGGAIILSAGGPMTAIVCTRKGLPTTNYELSFEARRTDGGDFFAA